MKFIELTQLNNKVGKMFIEAGSIKAFYRVLDGASQDKTVVQIDGVAHHVRESIETIREALINAGAYFPQIDSDNEPMPILGGGDG